MKKLLIHFGYPKTATTTLQEELFLSLHDKGLINFLGRTTKSSHTRTGVSDFSGLDFAQILRRHFYTESEIININELLSLSKLNVLSDEDFLFPAVCEYARFGKYIVFEEKLNFIKSMLGDDVDVSIFINLRNQANLIESAFLQKYRFLWFHTGFIELEDFLFNEHKLKDLNDFLDCFNFQKISVIVKRIFNVNAEFLFFEDFVNNKAEYNQSISSLLNIPIDVVSSCFSELGLRRKVKNEKFNAVNFYERKLLFNLFETFSPNLMIKLQKRYYQRSNAWLSREETFFYKKRNTKINKASADLKKRIKLFYLDSNIEFCNSDNFLLDKFSKYNYI